MKKYCYKPSDIPQDDHYAIVEFDSVYIPGDERSRTNPGHGYPAHSEDTCKYIAFTDKGEWEAEINDLMTGQFTSTRRERFVALKVSRARVSLTTNVRIEND